MNKRGKTVFGNYLVEQIKAADMSQEEFYTAVEIKKPYFYDILRASPPPTDIQNRMLKVLDNKTGENEERRRKLYDLAAAERGEIPADIVEMISSHPDDIDEIRTMLAKLFATQR